MQQKSCKVLESCVKICVTHRNILQDLVQEPCKTFISFLIYWLQLPWITIDNYVYNTYFCLIWFLYYKLAIVWCVLCDHYPVLWAFSGSCEHFLDLWAFSGWDKDACRDEPVGWRGETTANGQWEADGELALSLLCHQWKWRRSESEEISFIANIICESCTKLFTTFHKTTLIANIHLWTFMKLHKGYM